MKPRTTILLAMLFTVNISAMFAQTKISVEAANFDISYNLDLQAVASLFGESYDLEDFEMRLNNPENPVSNLDLNNDGYVDYLRVVEVVEGKTRLVIIQAVVAKDVYQDVATIVVERKNKKNTYIQVVGNDYLYGQNYIITPVYVVTPPIYGFFWGPRYHVWYSPYYWDYYPAYYRYYYPRPIHVYCHHIHVHINQHNHYNYGGTIRNERRYNEMSRRESRSDYASRNPSGNFSSRNTGVANRSELRDISRDNVSTENGSRLRENAVTGGIPASRGDNATINSRVTRPEVSTRPTISTSENGRENAIARPEVSVRENVRAKPATVTRENNAVVSSAQTINSTELSTRRRVSSDWNATRNVSSAGSLEKSNATPQRVERTVGSMPRENASSVNSSSNSSSTRPSASSSSSSSSSGAISRPSSSSSSSSSSTVSRPSSSSSSSSSSTVSRPNSSSSSSSSGAISRPNSSSSSSSSSAVSRPSSSPSNSSSSAPSRSSGSSAPSRSRN